MVREKAGVRKRSAKAARRRALVAKPSRPAPRSAPAAKPARPRLLASADLSRSLGYRIRRAQLWVFKDVSRRLAAFDISPAQFSVLSVIEANPGVNQLAIAQSLSIERAGLGRLVDHLERRGVVQRSASAINRRYYVLHLTESGTALLGRLRPAIAESERALATKIGPGPFKELQRALSIFLEDD
ncbi:MarR family winged helix-turn-helix transcriptional regulator [Bradyrhizobium canariense]|uniref:MarR family winged helix-turn-helix transcriptional regulator n=1 Tax=Bradyrhizobium canariense TaxID=255045 RepID=UPI001B8A37E6|nr:MarR family transcriptional regulator [Bradyrhizobium canariense]MBR0951067.1 MarR family transcriptional regulator [Bradyrhizobium canariense]